MLYSRGKTAIIFFDEYASGASKARQQAKQGKGLKILTPKQILQRLPIALAQVKAGNNSERLLNEIRLANYLFFVSIKRNYQKSR